MVSQSLKKHTKEEVLKLIEKINDRIYNYTDSEIVLELLSNKSQKGDYAIKMTVNKNNSTNLYRGSLDALYHYLNGIEAGEMIAGEDLSEYI